MGWGKIKKKHPIYKCVNGEQKENYKTNACYENIDSKVKI